MDASKDRFAFIVSLPLLSRDLYWLTTSDSSSLRMTGFASCTVIFPFIFEHFIFIDDDSAFAKYNGKYGILDVKRSFYGIY